MSELTWKRVKPIENNSVSDFESNKGIIIPEALKKLIESYNGGRPSKKIFVTDEGQEYEVKSLLSYNESDIENIYKVSDYFLTKYQKTILPFASESSGNYYCMNITNKSILLWNHENDEIKILASNLSDFISKLTIIE